MQIRLKVADPFGTVAICRSPPRRRHGSRGQPRWPVGLSFDRCSSAKGRNDRSSGIARCAHQRQRSRSSEISPISVTTPLTEIGSVGAGHHAYLGAGKMRRGRRINLRSGYYTVQVRVTMIELSADKMRIATPAADCNAVTNAEPVAVGQIAVSIVTGTSRWCRSGRSVRDPAAWRHRPRQSQYWPRRCCRWRKRSGLACPRPGRYRHSRPAHSSL